MSEKEGGDSDIDRERERIEIRDLLLTK